MLTSGCFRYVPVSAGGAPAAGEEVRVRLSEGGLAKLAQEIREQQRGSVVEGEVVEADARALVLAVSVGSEGARPGRELRQRVVIAVEDVVGLELKQLDRRRTYIALGGAATVLGAFAVTELLGGFGGSTRPPGPPDPPEMTGTSVFRR